MRQFVRVLWRFEVPLKDGDIRKASAWTQRLLLTFIVYMSNFPSWWLEHSKTLVFIDWRPGTGATDSTVPTQQVPLCLHLRKHTPDTPTVMASVKELTWEHVLPGRVKAGSSNVGHTEPSSSMPECPKCMAINYLLVTVRRDTCYSETFLTSRWRHFQGCNFPLITALDASQRFWQVVSLYLLISIKKIFCHDFDVHPRDTQKYVIEFP